MRRESDNDQLPSDALAVGVAAGLRSGLASLEVV